MSVKLTAARGALHEALNADDGRETRRYVEESIEHMHALERELAREERRRQHREERA